MDAAAAERGIAWHEKAPFARGFFVGSSRSFTPLLLLLLLTLQEFLSLLQHLLHHLVGLGIVVVIVLAFRVRLAAGRWRRRIRAIERGALDAGIRYMLARIPGVERPAFCGIGDGSADDERGAGILFPPLHQLILYDSRAIDLDIERAHRLRYADENARRRVDRKIPRIDGVDGRKMLRPWCQRIRLDTGLGRI
jgi:hypothetical protein